jgi:hypothetical protein
MKRGNIMKLLIITGILWEILSASAAARAQTFPSSPPQFFPPTPTGPPAYTPIPPQQAPPVQQAPSPGQREKGVINPRTGEFYPGTEGGVINPQTGVVLPKVGGGYLNPQTGEVIPQKE